MRSSVDVLDASDNCGIRRVSGVILDSLRCTHYPFSGSLLSMRFPSLFLTAVLLLLPAVSEAQVLPSSDPGSSVRTREDLQRLLQEYEQALSSPAYSASVKRTIREDAEQIRGRLENGDFRVGDRIALYVQGETELPDTVAVEAGPKISLPLFGDDLPGGSAALGGAGPPG